MNLEHFEVPETIDSSLKKKILDLRIRCFPELRGTLVESEEHWDWKFRSRSSQIWLSRARESGDLLGFYSCIPLEYLSPQGALRVGLVVDVMTAPEARGKGVFAALGSAATKGMLGSGYDLLTGYPVRPDVLPGHKKVAWSFCEKMPVYATPALKPLGCLLGIVSRIAGFTVEVVDPKELGSLKGWAEFYSAWKARAAESGLTFMDTGGDFHRWRYASPTLKYLALAAYRRDGSLAGYATYREMRLRGLRSLALADVKVLSPLAFVALTGAMARKASLRTLLISGMFSRAVAQQLRPLRVSMIRLPVRFLLILKAKGVLGERLIERSGVGGFYLTWADTDDV